MCTLVYDKYSLNIYMVNTYYMYSNIVNTSIHLLWYAYF